MWSKGENLETAFQNEIRAKVNEYPKFIQDPSEEGKECALKSFPKARDVENRYAELYKRAMNNMVADCEVVCYVCQVCGYISEDEASESCPIRGTVKSKFKKAVYQAAEKRPSAIRQAHGPEQSRRPALPSSLVIATKT
ncbi:MAG: rubrerythrin family protein [Deltaproteobacteria bacterium]|nr:rubrerythrin family protein [Deltaproteobacteria bacterium]